MNILRDGLDTQFSIILEHLSTLFMMISFLEVAEFVHVIIQLERLTFVLHVLTDGLVRSGFIISQRTKLLRMANYVIVYKL